MAIIASLWSYDVASGDAIQSVTCDGTRFRAMLGTS
jgi:hypothetical protein